MLAGAADAAFAPPAMVLSALSSVRPALTMVGSEPFAPGTASAGCPPLASSTESIQASSAWKGAWSMEAFLTCESVSG